MLVQLGWAACSSCSACQSSTEMATSLLIISAEANRRMHLHLCPARRSIAIQLSVGIWICGFVWGSLCGSVRSSPLHSIANFQVQCGDFCAWGHKHTYIYGVGGYVVKWKIELGARFGEFGRQGTLGENKKKFKKKETERASDPFICVVPVALAWIWTAPFGLFGCEYVCMYFHWFLTTSITWRPSKTTDLQLPCVGFPLRTLICLCGFWGLFC